MGTTPTPQPKTQSGQYPAGAHGREAAGRRQGWEWTRLGLISGPHHPSPIVYAGEQTEGWTLEDMRTTLLHPPAAGRVGTLGALGTASQRPGCASRGSACPVSKAASPQVLGLEEADVLLSSSLAGGAPRPHLSTRMRSFKQRPQLIHIRPLNVGKSWGLVQRVLWV